MTTRVPKDELSSSIPTPEISEGPKARASIKIRLACWIFGGVCLLTIALCGAITWLAINETRLNAPHWLRADVEERLQHAAPQLRVRFGAISVFLKRNGQVRISVGDVDVTNLQGQHVVQLNALEAGVSGWDLLRGRAELRAGRISGAFITVLRNKEGRIGLALGDAFASDVKAPSVPEMIAVIDDLAQQPWLSGLNLVEADALTIRYEDARARRGWTVDGGRVKVTRAGGEINLFSDMALLSGGATAATLSVEATSEIGKESMRFAFDLTDLPAHEIATQSPALVWLDALRAPISGSFRSGLDEGGDLDDFSASLKIGAGALQPSSATRPIPFHGASAYFTYHRDKGLLSFDEVDVKTDLADVTLAGRAALRGLETGWLTSLEGQFSVSHIRLAEGVVFDQEKTINGAELSFKLLPDPFSVTLGELIVTDQKYPLQAKGRLSARSDGWHGSIDAQVSKTTTAEVMKLWPERLFPGTRDWVGGHVKSGDLEDMVVSVRMVPDSPPSAYLEFGFDNAQVDYAGGFADVTNGRGHFVLHDHRMVISLDDGITTPKQVPLGLAGTELVIANTQQKPPQAQILVQSTGELTGYLDFIDQEPLKILKKAGFNAQLATGQVQISGQIALPFKGGLRSDDIMLDLVGTAQDVSSSSLVTGHLLEAAALDVALKDDVFEVSGTGQLSGVGFSGVYTHALGGSSDPSILADVDINDENLKALGIVLPSGMLSGTGRGNLAMTIGQTRHEFQLTTNGVGLGLAIPELNWRKAATTPSDFFISGALGQAMSVDTLRFDGAGLSAQGDITFADTGAFQALNLSRLALQDWLDVEARLVARGARAPAVFVNSGHVDLRRATFGGGSSSGEGGAAGSVPMSVALSRLQVADTIWLDRFSAEFDAAAAGMTGQFEGRLGGQTPVSGQMKPGSGGTSFEITGEDAGDILKATQFIDTVRDGAFELSLTPVRGATGTYDGNMKIMGPRVQDAPAIGALLDAVSIVGILDELNGSGIYFDKVEGDFRITPNRVILEKSSAVGPSMGVSLDGYYDLNSSQLDMQGVLSPVYILNSIGRLFSKRDGEGLIGFNFTLGGTSDDPKVQINPLSIFTPGAIRDIFRRPTPTVDN